MNLDRLLDTYSQWRPYCKGRPFRVYIFLHPGYKIPPRVFKEELEGYFIISSNNSTIHLIKPDLNIYKKEDEFLQLTEGIPEQGGENGVLYINKAPKLEAFIFKKQLYVLQNNFYYQNGWFQQLVNV